MKIKRVHRITLAVRDLAGARATFERLFDADAPEAPAVVPSFGIRSVDLRLGEATLQIASPVGADNSVMRFLERKGEGFYNVALEVDDLDAAVAELAAHGVRISEPVEAERGLRSAFITMSATHGLSIQLVQVLSAEAPPESAPQPAPEATPALASEAAPTADAAARIERAEPTRTHQPPLDLTPDEWSDVD